jgi:pseudouridine 5'-phosphatase
VHLLSFFPNIPLTIDTYLAARRRMQDELWPTVTLLPGVSALVLHLQKHRVPIAIATGSQRRNYVLKTQHEAVREVFACFELGRNVVCGDPLVPEEVAAAEAESSSSSSSSEDSRSARMGIKKGRGKPHPDVYLVAAKECLDRAVGDVSIVMDGVAISDEERDERSKGLVFEDAVPGVQSAKRAGMNGESLVIYCLVGMHKC